MSNNITSMTIAPMYSCEGARVLRDADGIAFIEVDTEPTDQDWKNLLNWVKENGFSFGAFGPLLDFGDEFDDQYGDRFILVDLNEDREEAKAA